AGLLQRDVDVLQLGSPGPASRGVTKDGVYRTPVLALERSEQLEPLLDFVEPTRGATIEIEHVAPELAAEIIGFVAQRLQPLGERREPGVHLRHRLQLLRGAG